jgi:hypothetical protein
MWNWHDESLGGGYERAALHTMVLGLIFNWFGVNVIHARIVSVFFGMLTLAIITGVSRYFSKSYTTALVVLMLLSFHPRILIISRFIRMYSMVIPFFLLAVYFLYRGISEHHKLNKHSGSTSKWIKSNLNIRFDFVILGALFLYIAMTLHLNVMVVIPAVFIFIGIRYLLYRSKTDYHLILLSLPLMIFAASFRYQEIINFLSIPQSFKYEYFNSLLAHPFGFFVGLILFTSSLFLTVSFSDKQLQDRYIYLQVITLFSLLFFSLFADRYYHPHYIVHIVPFAIFILSSSYLWISGMFSNRRFRIYFLSLIPLAIFAQIYSNRNFIYDNKGHADYSSAYTIFRSTDSSNRLVILGISVRDYYLREFLDQPLIIVDIKRDQTYMPNEFLEDINMYPQGYVTWESRKWNHIHPVILTVIKQYFSHLSGDGINDTEVEIYSFSDDQSASASAQIRDFIYSQNNISQ